MNLALVGIDLALDLDLSPLKSLHDAGIAHCPDIVCLADECFPVSTDLP